MDAVAEHISSHCSVYFLCIYRAPSYTVYTDRVPTYTSTRKGDVWERDHGTRGGGIAGCRPPPPPPTAVAGLAGVAGTEDRDQHARQPMDEKYITVLDLIAHHVMRVYMVEAQTRSQIIIIKYARYS